MGQRAKSRTNDTVSIFVNTAHYQKRAADSIKARYALQAKLYDAKDHAIYGGSEISRKYRLEDLALRPVPIYRISPKALKGYNEDTPIEHFISFVPEGDLQAVVIMHRDTVLNFVDIPDAFVKQSTESKDPWYRPNQKEVEESMYVSLLDNHPSMLSDKIANTVLKERTHFFFKIFGIEDTLFEVDGGLLYANYIGPGKIIPKMLANEYINTYIGQAGVRCLARREYDLPKLDNDHKKFREQKQVVVVVKEVY